MAKIASFFVPENTMPKTVACPNCGKRIPWQAESEWRPFCSERCRLIDLGEWLDERHRISEAAEDSYAAQERDDGGGYH